MWINDLLLVKVPHVTLDAAKKSRDLMEGWSERAQSVGMTNSIGYFASNKPSKISILASFVALIEVNLTKNNTCCLNVPKILLPVEQLLELPFLEDSTSRSFSRPFRDPTSNFPFHFPSLLPSCYSHTSPSQTSLAKASWSDCSPGTMSQRPTEGSTLHQLVPHRIQVFTYIYHKI